MKTISCTNITNSIQILCLKKIKSMNHFNIVEEVCSVDDDWSMSYYFE